VVIEICGMALVIQLITHLSYLWWVPVTALTIAVILWFSSFEIVENGAAIMGLTILVFVVAAVKLAPPWGEVAKQLVVPQIPSHVSLTSYGFAAVSLLGAFTTPYEVFFYSSGAIEERWSGRDFITNRVTGIVGFAFGSTIVIAMMIVSAMLFFPHGIQSQTFSSIPVPVESALGVIGLVFFLIGAFACTTGAALETALASGYSLCQFFGWDWGENHDPKDAPVFTFAYILVIVLGAVVAFTGIDPAKLTIYTTALAAFSLPFTFIPLFIVANDEDYMGDQRNSPLVNAASIFFLIVLGIVTVVTIPLFILSGGGG
jgi:manganese transport protein